MIAHTYSVAFEGVEPRLVEVQCALSPGLPAFSIVGLADKAVSEARERIRSALSALSIALPARRITINLSPADMPKEGAHFDLPITLALLAAIDLLPSETVETTLSLGELSLDGRLNPVQGALPAALAAAEDARQLICPRACAAEAAWVTETAVIGAESLSQLLRHFTGQAVLSPAQPTSADGSTPLKDLRDVKGQERCKRALEIAAAGRHHCFLCGPPGAGKSMMAARLPGLLPPLTAREALETAVIHSIAGTRQGEGLSLQRPYRDPHHTASVAALAGGGRRAGPGEITLAHNGVLFLDELPEFSRTALETLRQPLETGEIAVARANAHVRYPCRFLLIAAANPCRCGHLADPAKACNRAPNCGQDYLGKLSGPLLDRFDLRVEVPPVGFEDLDLPPPSEGSAEVAARVAQARALQDARYEGIEGVWQNADADGELLQTVANPGAEGRDLLQKVAKTFGLSARGYHRVLRVARTIADLEGAEDVARHHIGEAVSYRLAKPTCPA